MRRSQEEIRARRHKIDLLELPKETLAKIVEMYAENAMSLDGLWATRVEEKFGLDTALEIDTKVWEEYAAIQAGRIGKAIGREETGTGALVKALNFQITIRGAGRGYAFQEVTEDKVLFTITSCRSQKARVKRGLGEFPCKSAGITYYEKFAKTIDTRFRLKCLLCPPDSHPEDLWCSWEFTLEK